jgi:selenium-binding protein 1
MDKLRPDPTFHPSPRLAMEAEVERVAYTALLSPDRSRPDALAVVDVDPRSRNCGSVLRRVELPNRGDELHHFGWNACSSALSPLSGHPFLQRRYLVVPGMRSSRIYIFDTQPDPTDPRLIKTIEPQEIVRKTGYSRPHTVHCGPEGIYVSTLGGAGPDGTEGPPGVFIIDCQTFEVLGRWEIDRGPQKLHYDFWWNLPRDYMVSSEWALPPQFENGLVPEDLLSNKYGHGCTSGTCATAAMCRPSTSVPITRWRSRYGPHTIRPGNTALSAWWSTPPISRHPSGHGGARTENSTPRRRPPSRLSPKTPPTCLPC